MMAVLAVVILLAPSVRAQITQRVSLSSVGTQGNDASGGWDGGRGGGISDDGRYVVFGSYASDLVPGDTNGAIDVFLRDRRTGRTDRVNLGPGGVEADDESWDPRISADGRFVVFSSLATNLVDGDTNGLQDVFVRDLVTRTTERVSVSSSGEQGNDESFTARISADGRFVVFFSYASNLVPGDTNQFGDIFVRDRQAGTTERVSVSSSGAQAMPTFDDEDACDISADGRYVAFVSDADNLVPGDTNWNPDVFVRDRLMGTTVLASIATDGTQQYSNNFDWFDCCISPDGHYVAFTSDSAGLVPGDTNDQYDVFLRDLRAGTLERASVAPDGSQLHLPSYGGSISAGARYVVFETTAHFVPGDTNNRYDVFVRDQELSTTERVSLGAGGVQADDDTGFGQITSDGRFVSLWTASGAFAPGDTNGFEDVFVRDLFGGPDFASLCDPGAGSVIACPCGNAPSGPARGCENSAHTGGAELTAQGGTFLSSDSLYFEVQGEPASALSLLLQGTTSIASGAVYGQGVRCVGGSIRRLYTTSAESSSVLVPDFAAGDAPISARSSAMGDVIRSGEQRWYQVVYRDPIELGGCPGSSTFNATQAGLVTWGP
jgi:Tol biopolymer transport system component